MLLLWAKKVFKSMSKLPWVTCETKSKRYLSVFTLRNLEQISNITTYMLEAWQQLKNVVHDFEMFTDSILVIPLLLAHPRLPQDQC